MILALPFGSGCPWACIMRLHSSLSWSPAAEWMALSIQPWQGQKHPSKALLHALTMASAWSRVMSPCQTAILGCPATEGILIPSTTPLRSRSADRRASCMERNSGFSGMGGRRFIKLRSSRRWLAVSCENFRACDWYSGISVSRIRLS